MTPSLISDYVDKGKTCCDELDLTDIQAIASEYLKSQPLDYQYDVIYEAIDILREKSIALAPLIVDHLDNYHNESLGNRIAIYIDRGIAWYLSENIIRPNGNSRQSVINQLFDEELKRRADCTKGEMTADDEYDRDVQRELDRL